MTLRREQSIRFLETVLNISDVEEKMQRKLEFVNGVLRAFHARIPNHNIKLLATEPDDRKILPVEEMIEDCFESVGGSCYVLNSFVNVLLTSLGFNIRMSGSSMTMSSFPNNHVINLISGIENPNDLYLVDTAAWYPTFEAISLHNLYANANPKTYKNGFLEYKFVREGDVITRLHRKNKTINEYTVGKEEWRSYYFFNIEEKPNLFIIKEAINDSYKNQTSGLLTMVIFALYPKGKSVTFSLNKLRIYDYETGLLKVVTVNSAEEFYSAILPYWPQISLHMVQKCMRNVLVQSSDYYDSITESDK